MHIEVVNSCAESKIAPSHLYMYTVCTMGSLALVSLNHNLNWRLTSEGTPLDLSPWTTIDLNLRLYIHRVCIGATSLNT